MSDWLVPPSPKTQNQLLMDPEGVELLSWKFTDSGAHPAITSKEKSTVGASYTLMKPVFVIVLGAPPFETVSVTSYSPGAEKIALGFWRGEELPLPNVHAHEVGDPVDVSVNLTVRGKHPLVTSAVKSATCAMTGGASKIASTKKENDKVRRRDTGGIISVTA